MSTFDSVEDLHDSSLVFEMLSNATSAVEAAAAMLRTSSPSTTTTARTAFATLDQGTRVLTTLQNTSALTLVKNMTAMRPLNSTSSPSRSPTYYYYGPLVVGIFCFFLTIFALLSVLGNSFVILTIVRHRGMRTRTNLLLANLAIADIMVAVLDMPVAVITLLYGDWKFPTSFCYFNGFTVGLGLMLSVHTLMWISIHKYISITRPLSRVITRRRIGYMIATCWIWATLYNLTPLMGLTKMVYKKGASQCGPIVPESLQQKIHSYVNTFCNLVLPLVVMSYCYYNIFAEVKQHLSRMRDSSNLDFRNTVLQQHRISLTLFIVLACFIICWMPYVFYSMSLVIGGKANVNVVLNPIAYLFGYMNSACNPIIYALRSPSFRRSYKDIIYGRGRRLRGTMTANGYKVYSQRHPAYLETFRGSLIRGAGSGRSHRHGNRANVSSEREGACRTSNMKYKKVVVDQGGTHQGLAKMTAAPDYDMGRPIAVMNNSVDHDDLPRMYKASRGRTTKEEVVKHEAYSEGCVNAYITDEKTRLDSPLRTRHKSEQIRNRRIPEIHLTSTWNEKQRSAFFPRPLNQAEDKDEADPVSPTFPRESFVQNFAHEALEESICFFVEPPEKFGHEGGDVNSLDRHLLDSTRKKSPDEIRSWYSEEFLDSEKGRSEDTFDVISVSASNPNLIKHLSDDDDPERKGGEAYLGVQGPKIRSNSHREVLFFSSESNLVGPKKTASANDIDVGQEREESILAKQVRPRVYTEGDNIWNTSREARRQLMWQASVEGLGESPLQSRAKLHFRMPERKIFHDRRIAKDQLSREDQNRGPEKTNDGNFLGITSILTTVKRSFSDFFLVEPSSETEDRKKRSSIVLDL